MTDTTNLGLPLIEASQAQKHVTHNEALRILDAAIQIAVQDITRTAPPSDPAEGQRHAVAAGAGGAWAGHSQAIATWQDGAWAFLIPKPGWLIWSLADQSVKVFDGSLWRNAEAALDNVPKLGINTAADSSNRFAVKSNAALLTAIAAADSGSGDVRLQLAKESAARTASVVFSNNYSGRAEFGLVGSDGFKLKVSADGAGWVEAFTIDPGSGNLTLLRGLTLSGVVAPPQLTANVNDYAPAGGAAAAVLKLSADAARSLSGLAGGAEGRVLCVINAGGPAVTLLDDGAASLAANRFALGGNLTLASKRAAVLRYDGTAARWQLIAGGHAAPPALPGYLSGLTLSTAGASASFAVAPGVATDSTAAETMTLAAAITKTTSAWAAGSGNGALDTGVIGNNTWYHVYLIERPDSGGVDVLISTSPSSPTLPANYTLSRHIGFLKTNAAGQWLAFWQNGDTFLWSDLPALDYSAVNPGTAAVTVTLSNGVPPGFRVEAILNIELKNMANQLNGYWLLTSPDVADVAANIDTSPLATALQSNGSSSQGRIGCQARVFTNTNAQIRSRLGASSADISVYVQTMGYVYRRGRDS